jgi:hypothetical protein
MKIKNFTPHEIVLVTSEKNIVFPSVGNARVSVVNKKSKKIEIENNVIELFTENFGSVEGLPAPELGTLFIVSRLVFDASHERNDLTFPIGLIRDQTGKIVGCKGLRTI